LALAGPGVCVVWAQADDHDDQLKGHTPKWQPPRFVSFTRAGTALLLLLLLLSLLPVQHTWTIVKMVRPKFSTCTTTFSAHTGSCTVVQQLSTAAGQKCIHMLSSSCLNAV
jgi:hypothetical protein